MHFTLAATKVLEVFIASHGNPFLLLAGVVHDPAGFRRKEKP